MSGLNSRPPKRAIRRHHTVRRKAWVRKNLGHYFLDPRDPPPRRVGLYADTPTVCSCWMCGNPRRYLGEPTLQERVHEEAWPRAQDRTYAVHLLRFEGTAEEG